MFLGIIQGCRNGVNRIPRDGMGWNRSVYHGSEYCCSILSINRMVPIIPLCFLFPVQVDGTNACSWYSVERSKRKRIAVPSAKHQALKLIMASLADMAKFDPIRKVR